MHNNKPKTLVILSPGFPENEEDSSCIPFVQVAVRSLKDENPGLNIIVLAFQYPFFSAQYQWYGVDVISFGGKNRGGVFSLLVYLRVWLTLRKLNKGNHLIGLLSFWLGKCAYIGDAFAKKYKLKHYCWLMGQDARPGNKYIPKIKPTGESLIPISDFVADGLRKNYNISPVHVIPIGINTTMFNSNGAIKDIDILGAGSLIPLKQYSIFLGVVKLLKQYFPSIKTVICGDGPEMIMLQEMVLAMDLQNTVTLAGNLDHNEVLKMMGRSKILLHPSNYEGFSTVCAEALYAGARVVSFIKPMHHDIENWYIAADKEDMVQLLSDILQNTGLKYYPVLPYPVQNSTKKIIKLFD